MRELKPNELDVVTGGQSLVGGPGSVVDIATTGAAVTGILGGVGSLLGSAGGVVGGLLNSTSSTGTGLLGGLLG